MYSVLKTQIRIFDSKLFSLEIIEVNDSTNVKDHTIFAKDPIKIRVV